MPKKRGALQALCLDMFDVAVNYDLSRGEEAFACRLGVPKEIISWLLDQAGRREFSWGAISNREFLARLNSLAQPEEPLTEDDLALLWCQTYAPNLEVVGLLPSLSDVAPVFFATNGNAIDVHWAETRGITIGPCVRRVLCAQALRARKPHTDFFRRLRRGIRGTLSRNVRFSQLCLVDDDKRNIDAALNLGMRAIWYTGPASITTALQCFSEQ